MEFTTDRWTQRMLKKFSGWMGNGTEKGSLGKNEERRVGFKMEDSFFTFCKVLLKTHTKILTVWGYEHRRMWPLEDY